MESMERTDIGPAEMLEKAAKVSRDAGAVQGDATNGSSERVLKSVVEIFDKARVDAPVANLHQTAIKVIRDFQLHNKTTKSNFHKVMRKIIELNTVPSLPKLKKKAAYADLFSLALKSAASITDLKTRFKNLFMLARFALRMGELDQAKLIYKFAMDRLDTLTRRMKSEERSKLMAAHFDAYLDIIEAEDAPAKFKASLSDLLEMHTKPNLTTAQKALNYDAIIVDAEQSIKSSPNVARKVFFILSLARGAAKIGLNEVAEEKYLLAVRAYENNCLGFSTGEQKFLKDQFEDVKVEFEARIAPKSAYKTEMHKAMSLQKSTTIPKKERAFRTLLTLTKSRAFARLKLNSYSRISSQLMIVKVAAKLGLVDFATETYAKAKEDLKKSRGGMTEAEFEDLFSRGLDAHSQIMHNLQTPRVDGDDDQG